MGNAGDEFWVQYNEYMQDNILLVPSLDDPTYEICNKEIGEDSIRYCVKSDSSPPIDSILPSEKVFDSCESSEDHRDDYMSHFERNDKCISEVTGFDQEEKVSTVKIILDNSATLVSKEGEEGIQVDVVESSDASNIGSDVGRIQNMTCHLCNTLFSSPKELQEHQTSSKCAKKKYKCLFCGTEFKNEERLEKHIINHKLKRCHVCGKEFTRHAHLSTHLLVHSNIRPWSCINCNRSFTDKSSLTKHQLVHTGVREYECDICNKTFQRAQHLLRHKEAHQGVKNFHCGVCARGFQLKNSLKVHMNTHSDEKPFKCEVCQRPFADKYALKRHKVVHEKMSRTGKKETA